MIRLDADNNFRILIVASSLDYSHLLSSDRQHRYQIYQCESASEALSLYQQEPSGCILLDWESSTSIDKESMAHIHIALIPVVILFEIKNADIVSQNTEDCLAKETLTPELISFAIGQAIAKAALKQKLAEAEHKLQKYEHVTVEKPQPSRDFLLSIHNLLSRQLQKELRDRQANENLLKIQNEILEKIAKGDELSEVLDILVLKIETQLRNALCTILISDQHGKLNHGSILNLPKAFANQCNGIPIREGVGSCGTAAFRKETVIVPDISTDSLWRDYKELALENGLFACWSFPIINREGLVLGTFGVYHRKICTPTTQELEIVSLAANIAGIALERDRATQELQLLNQELEMRVEQRTIALQESESRYRLLSEFSPVGIFRFDKPLNCIYVNDRWSEMTGRSKESALGFGWMETLPPEDRDYMIAHWAEGFASPNAIINQSEGRHLRPDGSINWYYVQVAKEIDASGAVTGYIGTLTDITDRKLSEMALQRSKASQQAIIDCIPDLLMRVSRKGILLEFFANPSFNVIGNLPESVGHNITDFLPPDVSQKRIDAIQLALKSNSIQIYEQDISRNSIMQIEEVRVVPSGNDEVLVLVRDISDRKAAELALLASEANNQTMLGAIPDLLLRLGRDGTCFAYIKPGIGAENFLPIDNHISEVLPEDLLQKQLQTIEQAISTGELQVYEHQFLKQDRMIYEEVRILAINNDEVLAVVRDISDRKMAELNLARSQAELNYHIDNSPLATIRWDREFRIAYWSKQAEKIFGWKAEEVLGKGIYDCQLIFEDDIPHVQKVAEQLMKGLPQTCQNRNYRKDGTIIHCEWYNSVLMDENGELISMLSLTQDITKRKQIEIEIAQSREALSQTAATLKQQMERQNFITHITQQIHQSLNIEEILTTAVNEIKRLLNGDRVVIFQFIDGVTKVVKEMVNPEYLSIIDMDIADNYFTIESINYHLNLNHDLALYSSDIAVKSINYHLNFNRDDTLYGSDTNSNEYSEKFVKQASIKSQIVIPIIQHIDSGRTQEINQTDDKKYDQLWGLLIVHSCARYRHWQNEEVDLLKQIANQLAIAIQQANLYQKLLRQATTDRLLNEISISINQSSQNEKLINIPLEKIRHFFEADRIVIYQFLGEYQKDSRGLVVQEAVTRSELSIIDRVIEDSCFATSELGKQYCNGKTSLISDILTSNLEPCYLDLLQQLQIRANLVVPIIYFDQLWGLLILHQCDHPRHWQAWEVSFLQKIATQIGTAGQKQKLYLQLSNELHQKKVLLKEIHHRVKNNLQVMSSILYLQFRNAPSEIKILTEEYQNRILAMSLIHEQLYRSDDLAHIDFHNYISNLTANLFECYGICSEVINLAIEVEDICLSLDQSIPLGLIINELVSNALKYAFPEKHGQIKISLIQNSDQIILTISDNGVGLPDDFDLENAEGLGMQLILSLTEQLDGNLNYDGKNGLTTKISFPYFTEY